MYIIYKGLYMCFLVLDKELIVWFLVTFSNISSVSTHLLLLPNKYPFPHFSDQISYTLLFSSLLLPNLQILAMAPFCFLGFYSYCRLWTHIWRFGPKSLHWEKKWWLSFWVLTTSLNGIFSTSVHLPSIFVMSFSAEVDSVHSVYICTFSLSMHQLQAI